MIKFIFSDAISFLAGVLIVGGLLLFVIVMRAIFVGAKTRKARRNDTLSDEEKTPSAAERPKETDGALIEAHLNAIAQEIAVIKQIVSDKSAIEDVQKQIDALLTRKDTGGADYLQKEILKINAKLEAIYNVMSDLAKG
ncbi:MAG: hypothetical protein ABIJ11_06825 [Elusimicrobiota bacterium]